MVSRWLHALQPVDVFYFKPFETTLKEGKDGAMVKSNSMEPNKIILPRWVDKALLQIHVFHALAL
jgi:hypothetical protein